METITSYKSIKSLFKIIPILSFDDDAVIDSHIIKHIYSHENLSNVDQMYDEGLKNERNFKYELMEYYYKIAIQNKHTGAVLRLARHYKRTGNYSGLHDLYFMLITSQQFNNYYKVVKVILGINIEQLLRPPVKFLRLLQSLSMKISVFKEDIRNFLQKEVSLTDSNDIKQNSSQKRKSYEIVHTKKHKKQRIVIDLTKN